MGRHSTPGSSVNTKAVAAILTTFIGGGAAGAAELVHLIQSVRTKAAHVEEQVRSGGADAKAFRDRMKAQLRDLHHEVTTIPELRTVVGPAGPPGQTTVRTVLVTPAPSTGVRPVTTPTPTPTCRAVLGVCLPAPTGERHE